MRTLIIVICLAVEILGAADVLAGTLYDDSFVKAQQAALACYQSQRPCECSEDTHYCSSASSDAAILDEYCPERAGMARFSACVTDGCSIGGESFANYSCFYYRTEEPRYCEFGEDSKNGQQCQCPFRGDPVNVVTHENRAQETDLRFNTIFEKGFSFYRTYRSQTELDSPIGYGWTHNFNIVMEIFGLPEDNTYLIRDEIGIKHYFQDSLESDDADDNYEGIVSSKGHIVLEADGTFTWYRANGIIYKFDQDLRLTVKQDGHGNRQNFTYNAEGLLQSISDEATGRTITLVYNAQGRIAQIAGPVTDAVPDGIWVRYEYDAEGNLTRVEYADDNNGSAASGFEYIYADPEDVHNLSEKRNLAGEFLSSWEYYHFYGNDWVSKDVTRNGESLTFNYPPYSDNVEVIDARGSQTLYTIERIDNRLRIVGVSGDQGCTSCGGGDQVNYIYDEQRRAIEKQFGSGRIDQYADYDDMDRYHTEIQAVGTPMERTIHYTYHTDTGEYLSITEASNLASGDKETIFDYDDDGNVIPNENPTRLMHRKIERGFTYDAAGSVAPYEYITLYTYTAKGRVASIDGPLSGDQDKITYTYDPVTGDRLTENRPLAGTTTYGYDDAGNVTSITAADGTVTTISHDGRNRQVSNTRNGIATSRTYSTDGEISSTTDALNRTLNYTYNSAGFMEKIVDPSGNFMYYGYNNFGERTEESIYAADNTQTHYRGTDYGDPANNPDLITGKPWKSIHRNFDDSADLETTYAYDASGNLKSVTDANGNITSYHYDLFNRLEQVIQPGNATTIYAYDSRGNLTSVTDAEGHVTTYTYDDLGRLMETDSPDTGATLYTYDESGNLRFKVQNNNSIEYRYDASGRLTNILYSEPDQNVTMTYDSGAGANLVGRLASVADPSGLTEYSYDNDGRLEMETRTVNGIVFVTGYGYDDAGNLRSITYPTGQTIDYQPDTADPARIGAVVLNPYGSNQSLASAVAYKPFGPVAAMTLGNGITVSKSYDKNYQLLSLAAGAILDRSYIPDNVGNIQLITDNLDSTRSQSFDYDDLYRLTGAVGAYGTIGFTYDKVGNRLTRTRTGTAASQDSYTYYPGTNRLQTVMGDHPELIQYDTDGNIAQRIPGTANPQPPITDPADYKYNSAGQRAIKDATNDVVYHYDLSGQLIAETDATGNMLKAYVWLFGQPLAMITADGAVYYFHNDHLGTPQKMTDSSGAVVWAADYLPFGQADVTIATVENNLRFAGQYYDNETGLHYNYHRYYDPSLGRYLRADPIGLKDGTNPYLYVQNNPIKNIDPKGLCKWSGKITYAGVSSRIYGGMLATLEVKSECCNGKRAKATCHIMAGGFSGGLPVQGASSRISEMLGPDTPSWTDAQGPFSYFSVTASVPFIGGRASTAIGSGQLYSVESGKVSGFAVGADAFAGYANCWGEDENCCDN